MGPVAVVVYLPVVDQGGVEQVDIREDAAGQTGDDQHRTGGCATQSRDQARGEVAGGQMGDEHAYSPVFLRLNSRLVGMTKA